MERTMLNCLKCGSELKNGEKFCSKCGTLNIQPIKSRRWGWLPWVVALLTACSALIFVVPSVTQIYRMNTWYHRKSAVERVTVTDADYWTVSSSELGEGAVFRYPKVEIEGVKTDFANEEIESDMRSYRRGDKEDKYAADYTYFVSEKVVSVLIKVRKVSEEKSIYVSKDTEYFVYNISVETGKKLSNPMVVSKYGITQKYFFERVEDTYYEYFKTANLTEREEERLIENLSFSHIDPFIGEDGHLCFVVRIDKQHGPDEDAVFDSDTKKLLKVL